MNMRCRAMSARVAAALLAAALTFSGSLTKPVAAAAGDVGAPRRLAPPARFPEFAEFHRLQAFFCNSIYPSIRDYPMPYMKRVTTRFDANELKALDNIEIFVYDGAASDWLSTIIKDLGRWDATHTIKTIEALEEYRIREGLNKEDITFVDIGEGRRVLAVARGGVGWGGRTAMRMFFVLLRSCSPWPCLHRQQGGLHAYACQLPSAVWRPGLVVSLRGRCLTCLLPALPFRPSLDLRRTAAHAARPSGANIGW